jgi:hypothetical protein
MTQTSALTRAIIDLAVRTVPAGHRERYGREIVAELHDVPPGQRFAYAVQILLHAPALRSALARSRAPSTVRTRPRRPLRCILRRHRWRLETTQDGGRYERCAACGKDRYDGEPIADGSWMAAGWGGGGGAM